MRISKTAVKKEISSWLVADTQTTKTKQQHEVTGLSNPCIKRCEVCRCFSGVTHNSTAVFHITFYI